LVRKKLEGKFIQQLFDDNTISLEYAKLGCEDSEIQKDVCPCLLEFYELPTTHSCGFPQFNHVAITVKDVCATYKKINTFYSSWFIYSKPIVDENKKNKLFFCNISKKCFIDGTIY